MWTGSVEGGAAEENVGGRCRKGGGRAVDGGREHAPRGKGPVHAPVEDNVRRGEGDRPDLHAIRQGRYVLLFMSTP